MSAPFSVVVVLHDSARDLRRLLDSMSDHLADDPPQLVVVDTGSRDGGADLAAERGAEVVALAGNPGYGPANNAGMERVRSETTVLLNPDVVLLDDGLWRLAEIAADHEGLHAPRLLNTDGTLQRSAHPLPGTAAALVPALLHPRAMPEPLRLRADPWRATSPRRVGWAIGACLAGRTETLRALGPFDPRAFLFYEDLDLCLRARAAGLPTVLHPDVALIHRGGHSTRPALGGEAHERQARRRRQVVSANLGRGALALDDAAQALTFASRAAARRVLRRDDTRERAQLAAVLRARRDG